MAIFSKPPAKKPKQQAPKPQEKARPVAGGRLVSARALVSEVAARGSARPRTGAPPAAPEGVTTTNAKIVDLAQSKPGIEIEHASNGLCPAVENAALMFASGQMRAARELLQEGVASDADTKGSALAWLCLFDLLRRMGDKTTFDRLALQYLVQFERSAPGWEELGAPSASERTASGGGTVALSGRLTAGTETQLEPLKRIAQSDNTQLKLDLAGVTGYDDEGARLLAHRLADVRRRHAPLAVVRAEKLRETLETAVNEGREAGVGAWVLLLELLQWMDQQAAFDDRAVEYAVTFEMSPPSWEPVPPQRPVPPARKTRSRALGTDAEALAWTDAVTGATPREISDLLTFAESRNSLVLDMSALDRMDFASAGALANAVHRLQAQHKTLQIAGATPIVRALLLLVGVSADVFVRKPT